MGPDLTLPRGQLIFPPTMKAHAFLTVLCLTFGSYLLADARAQYVYEGQPVSPTLTGEGSSPFTGTPETERLVGPDGETPPDPNKSVPPIASPKPYGVFIMMGQKGLVAISPFAPPSLGYGVDNLTSTYENRGFSTVTGTHEGVYPYGGLTFFGWEF